MDADEIKTTKVLLLVLGIPGSLIIAAFIGFLVDLFSCKNLYPSSQALCSGLAFLITTIPAGIFFVTFVISLVCNLPKKKRTPSDYVMDKKTFLRTLGRSFLWATSVTLLIFCFSTLNYANGAWSIVLEFLGIIAAIALMVILVACRQNHK